MECGLVQPPAARELLFRLAAPPGHVTPGPRTLVVVAHPDDETIGLSSRLPRLEIAEVVFATDGAPRDGSDARAAGCNGWADYAALRRDEALRALAHAGVASERVVFLEHPDQQAAFRLRALAAEIKRHLRATEPEVVLTHAYEGGHPDHDAVAFAVHAAVQRLSREQPTWPAVVEFAGYHAHGDTWDFGVFLPGTGREEQVVRLTPAAQDLKRRLLAVYASQRRTLAAFPVDAERFRLAPGYDFTRPPHAGPLLYERYAWGLTASRWCELVREARSAWEREAPVPV